MALRVTTTREASWLKLRFLAGGVFNAATCVGFSQVFYLLLGLPVVAFAAGYAVSLSLSYVVNAVLVFRADGLSWRAFGLFCLSYVPNFFIQFVVVGAMTRYLGVLPLLAYVLGVAIAVPLTFLILSRVTFRTATAARQPSSESDHGLA